MDYEIANNLGLTNLDRWKDGIDHHPMSERLVRFMAAHDFNDYNDSMSICVGGDGDNGEQMMYLMDTFFEMLDMNKSEEIIGNPIYKTLINNEKALHYECVSCEWIGEDKDKKSKITNKKTGETILVCPNCSCDTFYGIVGYSIK